MKRTISVITPSFNQGRFIGETIESVISQKGDFFLEYLIMDGGSTDETVEVIKKYEKLLKEKKYPVACKGVELIWKSEKDRGQAHAVNKGFKAAKGEFLGWVNSDDTYLPGAIAKALEYLARHEDVMMVYGEGYHMDEQGKVIERYPTEPFSRERLLETCFICQPTVFLKKKVLEEIGYLDENLHFCMDYEYWIRVGESCKILHVPEYFANSRLHAETKTLSKTVDAYGEAIKTTVKHFGKVSDSWLYGYAHHAAKNILGESSLKNVLLKLITRIIFVLKKIQIRFCFGKV